MIKQIAQTLGLAALVAIGCGGKGTQIEVNQPRHFEGYFTTDTNRGTVWYWDLNADGVIDEAVCTNEPSLYGFFQDVAVLDGAACPSGLSRLFPCVSYREIIVAEDRNYEHLVAPGIGPGEQFLKTGKEKPMPDDLRTTLTTTAF